MATLQSTNSRKSYSWWWNSHITPKNSRWLQENLTDMDRNVKSMIKLIEEDADSFRKRAEMYYRKRPELIKLVEEFYRAYRALAEKYDHATGALRQAHRTMAEAFPDQIPFALPEEAPSGFSGIDSDFHMNFQEHEPNGSADEVSQLSEEIERLKSKIASESERADQARADLDGLKGTIAKLESDKEAASLQCQLSQARISGLEAELSRTEEDLKKLNNEMLSYGTNLKSVEEQYHVLEEGNKSLQLELDTFRETARIKQERISSLEVELSRAEDNFTKLSKDMSLNITKLKNAEEICGFLEGENQSLQSELDTLKDTIKTKQEQLDTLQQEIGELKVCLSDEKQRYVQIEKACQSLEELHSRSQEEVKILTLEVQTGVEVIKSMELSKAGLEEELKRLKEENTSLKDENFSFSLKILKLQDEISMLREVKSRLEDEVEHHVEENSSLKEENISCSLTITSLQDELRELKESQKRLEEEVQIHVEEKKVLQSDITSMKADKMLLEERHLELLQQIGAVSVNVESLRSLVKELKEGNVELKELCKMHEDERAVHLDNLRLMEKIAEKNDFLQTSLTNANAELEELREKVIASEELCSSLQDKISVHISEKVVMVSQMDAIARNMEKLSEQNTMLENSVMDANVELEDVREKLKSVEDTCQILRDKESNLLTEKSMLVTQVENTMRSLENSETRYAELECNSISLGKQKEEELEAEQHKLINARLENFILQRSLHDMTEKSGILSDKLQKESFEQMNTISALSQDNEKFLKGVNQVMNMLNINESPTSQHFELILHEIEDLKASLSDAQYEKQRLILEKAIILTFLKQSKLDMMVLESQKNSVEQELKVKYEELSVLQTEKQHLTNDVHARTTREEELNAELANLREVHFSLQTEIAKLIGENKSLSVKLYDVHQEKDALEEENHVLLQKVIATECLYLTYQGHSNERTTSLMLLENENSKLKMSVNATRAVCEQLNTEIEATKKVVEQKDAEMSQATQNFQAVQDRNAQLKVEIDDVKAVREEYEKKIIMLNGDKVDSDNKISSLNHANDALYKEVQDLKKREEHLMSELQAGISEANSCEEEIAALLIDSQIATVNSAIYEEKMLELLMTCESVEIRAMVQREKLYEEVTLRNAKLEAVSGENKGLKEELSAYMPLVQSLFNDIASLEECITSAGKRRSLQHLERQDDKLVSLEDERIMDEKDTNHIAPFAGTIELQKLRAKINALENILIDTMNHLEQEKSASDAMRWQDKGKEESKEKYGESYDQVVKDIQLDHVLSSVRYHDGASSRAPSTVESIEAKYEIEQWDTPDSHKPIAEVPRVDRKNQDFNGNVSGRLSLDYERLSLLQANVKELKRRMATSLLNESPKSVEFEKIKTQLKECEKSVTHLITANSKLVKKTERFSVSSGSLVSEKSEPGNMSERRSEKKVAEKARKDSEKIAMMELEIEKIRYIFLKLKEEDDFKRAKAAERRTRVLLRDYLYGRKESPRRKKISCCMIPKTKD